MPRFKATAFVDGKETEVELDDAQFITVETAKARTTRTVQDRLGKQAVSIRKELLDDEDFRKDVLKAAGVDQNRKPGDKTLTDADVAGLQEQWRAKELKPIQDQLNTTATSLESERKTALVDKLEIELRDKGVKKAVARRMAEIESGKFGFDDKSRQHAQRKADGDGFVFSTKATDARPFKGLDEFAQEFVADPLNADFVERQTQSGPGVGKTPGKMPVGTNGVQFRSQMSVEEKTKFIAENGYKKFAELPDKPAA